MGDHEAWKDALEARGVIREKAGRSYVLRLAGPWIIANPSSELEEFAATLGACPGPG